MGKFTWCFAPENPDTSLLKRLDRIFEDLVEKLGGEGNIIFAPMDAHIKEGSKLYIPDFNPNGDVVGIETSFVVKDLSLVSEKYKEYVHVIKEG